MADVKNSRKSTYKHVSIANSSLSQQARRVQALEDQKKRRASKVDALRQLESFGNLSLSVSDDEEDAAPRIVPQGLGAFVGAFESSTPKDVAQPAIPTPPPSVPRRSRKKRKGHVKKQDANETSEWADRCMYAELLEMNVEDAWGDLDGLPDDLETGWVAVAPVPVGKRCLAVAHQGSASAPNTILRSRALGKPLMPRFPSTLPPNTILDCILDADWRSNGILHVLDVIKWKSQDVADCETAFRFWWRDTRLAELTTSPPPTMPPSRPSEAPSDTYRFSYPTKLVPVPHHTNTTLTHLVSHVVPASRAARSLSVDIPTSVGDEGMMMDALVNVAPVNITVAADGLLLYVAEASYESGTSPLSSWVPIVSYNTIDGMDESAAESPLDKFNRLVQRRLEKRAIAENRDDDVAMEM
ncbi:hypothetical protein CYLTODRAFT_417926 [Cylindrobasidium torrendii FP15055 ss-10]|uniref:Snurportin-1 n=1 Tax=Cylindrobasidium torrendii FP15055 ss-10 TaxID=1314674 RepID=A0A0D7BRV8_9AGAR|nr:hypothetical protein CYLTODRAFT_417926 [Cylindrobasidium torrendii FP15055 ss-10]